MPLKACKFCIYIITHKSQTECNTTLVFSSGYVPRILGIVLVIAGVGYVTDSFERFQLPQHTLDLVTLVGWGGGAIYGLAFVQRSKGA